MGFLRYGIFIREITVPDDAVVVKDNNKWRADKLILGNKYTLEGFIEKFAERVDWDRVSSRQTLSEAFIEKYMERVDWTCISMHQKLSEAFIEKFAERVNWNNLSSRQTLSKSFHEKFVDKLGCFTRNSLIFRAIMK